MEIKNMRLSLESRRCVEFRNVDNVTDIKALPYFSLVQAVKGDYEIRLDHGQAYRTGEGGFFLAPAGVLQEITHHEGPDGMTGRWIFLDVAVNGHYPLDMAFDLPVVLSGENAAVLNGLMDRLFACDRYCREMSLCFEIMQTVLDLSREKQETPAPWVPAVLEIIRSDYASPLRVETLAEAAGLSASHFYTAFRRSFRQSPMEYLNRYRLAVASDLLKRTSLSVDEIADRVGIPDRAYFSKMFRRQYELPPAKYRRTEQ